MQLDGEPAQMTIWWVRKTCLLMPSGTGATLPPWPPPKWGHPHTQLSGEQELAQVQPSNHQQVVFFLNSCFAASHNVDERGMQQ